MKILKYFIKIYKNKKKNMYGFVRIFLKLGQCTDIIRICEYTKKPATSDSDLDLIGISYHYDICANTKQSYFIIIPELWIPVLQHHSLYLLWDYVSNQFLNVSQIDTSLYDFT